MIKYALKCENGHSFDAWFASAGAYTDQAARGLVSCPYCGGTDIDKALMAPSVATTRRREAEPAAPELPTEAPPSPSPSPDAMMAMMNAEARRRLVEGQLRALRAHVEATSEYVGDAFADEARRIHDGDVDARPIYGEATPEEARDLIDDGVPCAPIPWIDRRDD